MGARRGQVRVPVDTFVSAASDETPPAPGCPANPQKAALATVLRFLLNTGIVPTTLLSSLPLVGTFLFSFNRERSKMCLVKLADDLIYELLFISYFNLLTPL